MNTGVFSERGLFVCFEGGEGAGKSTQSRLLRDWLVERGEIVLLTYEPGDTAVGKELRRIVLDPATGDLSDRTEALLYAADKAEHVDHVVLPALARGEVVITDRYVDSTLAYQGAGRTLDEETRARRREVTSIPARLTSLGSCMAAATNLAELAKEETEAITAAAEKRELDDLQAIFGSERKDTTSRSYRAALGGLEKLQKQKAKRRVLDVIDRALMDLVSVYRDAIALSVGAPGQLVNEELRGDVAVVARAASPEELLRMIDAIFTAREQMLEFNVPPQLALESMTVALRLPGGR